ncbi:glucosamine-6-phosphate deaminase [Pseudoroseicyclus tamaricis]|uniref:Glucosamine-6-phosphate deaminase n=1 Tax=Pseudoroseicyclus tamaricis TaxID=2705421 RepID=A0A6B2JIU8_9RHOB|nr:glucosamine-6-phosphate deaminase [Pseudoroseicyclus tamaricis]NDV01331.1 glucosamine-6-phosphate deaminase [Pseudoroseicyclus tamaricis]
MKRIITDDAASLAETGARQLAEALAEEPALVAAIATGNSPIALYERLAELRAAGEVDAGQMTAVQLDSYIGTPDDDPRSLWDWMRRAFVAPMGLTDAQVLRFAADPEDPEAECARMGTELEAAGGLGLAVVGLGPNGHLGFNEPGSAPGALTRPVELSPESLQSNAAYWQGGIESVPRRAMTLGLAPLLSARRILLVVSGAHKHEILRRAVEGPVSEDCPASWLQRCPQATVIADRAAWEGA